MTCCLLTIVAVPVATIAARYLLTWFLLWLGDSL